MEKLDRMEVSIWNNGKLLCAPVIVLHENVKNIAAYFKKEFPVSTAVIQIKKVDEDEDEG